MNVRERIEAVLAGALPDQVPFTVYWLFLPRGEMERRLRNLGLGIIQRTDVIKWEYPNCTIDVRNITRDGLPCKRTTWRTPVGEVYSTTTPEQTYGTSEWLMDHPLKNKDDYRVLEFIAKDARPAPAYEQFLHHRAQLGNDGYVIAQLGYCPLMEMIVNLLGFERYAYELADQADAFWSLYEALCAKMRRAYPLAAASPARLVLYSGNVHPRIVRPEMFEKYCVSCYNELAEYLHQSHKLLGVHLDADTRLFKEIVASSRIDVIEALTPPPDCDMRLAEARRVWPDKILWINFPSSVHLSSADVIQETTRQLLREAAPGDRFLFGITEDIPADRRPQSLTAIAQTINQYGHVPIS